MPSKGTVDFRGHAARCRSCESFVLSQLCTCDTVGRATLEQFLIGTACRAMVEWVKRKSGMGKLAWSSHRTNVEKRTSSSSKMSRCKVLPVGEVLRIMHGFRWSQDGSQRDDLARVVPRACSACSLHSKGPHYAAIVKCCQETDACDSLYFTILRYSPIEWNHCTNVNVILGSTRRGP